MEGGAEPKLDMGDMAGDERGDMMSGMYIDGTGKILAKKSILSSRDREQSRALMCSDVGSMPKLCTCSKAHTV